MNAAIIGLGSMGKKHYKTLKLFDFVDVYTVDKYLEDSNFRSVEQLLKNIDIDFAIIATPTFTHSEVALNLLNHGVHVLIEKPVFAKHTEVNKIIDAMEKNDCKVAVGHVERYNPAFQALMKDLKNQKILNCNITRISPRPIRTTDVGVKLDLAIHDVDLIRLITKQEILNYSSVSTCSKGENEDTVSYFVSLDNGATATILASWRSPLRKRTMEILTDESFYEVDLLNQTITKHIPNNNISHIIEKPNIKREDALKNQLNEFIEYVNIGKIGRLATLKDAIAALKLVE